MRSKEWKHIVLKNPKLRLVRTSIRVILEIVIHTELKRLQSLLSLYRMKRVNGKITPSQSKRDRTIYQAYYHLDYILQHSILHCSEELQCRSIIKSGLSHNIATLALDMVWNPIKKAWVCLNCYNYYYKTNAQKQEYINIYNRIDFDD